MNKFPNVFITDKTGTGKTLFFCFRGNIFHQNFPKGKIIANFHLFKVKGNNYYFRKKDFIYSPLGLLPLDLLENEKREYPIMLLIDDSEAIENTSYYIEQLTRLSRKSNICLYLIGHYRTDVNRKKRSTMDYRLKVNYLKSIDFLELVYIDDNEVNYQVGIKNAVKRLGSLYDTNEIVIESTPSIMNTELKKYSNSLVELEKNLKFLIKGKIEYKNELKRYKELFGY